MYETFELKSLAYKESLKYNISLVKKLLAIIFAIVFLVSIGVTMMPLYMLIFQNIRVDIMPFIFPYIDTSTDFGFYLTFVLHIICVFFGAYGNFVVDCWLFIYAAHVPLLKNILKCKFDDRSINHRIFHLRPASENLVNDDNSLKEVGINTKFNSK